MNLKQQIIIPFFLLASLSLTFIYGQKITTISGRTIATETIDAFLAEQMKALKMPGLSIAIINDGQVVYERSLGVTNASTGQQVDERTYFEVASLTKPFFAYLVMKLAHEGRIDLDRPLAEYLPNPELDHDPRYLSITPRQVLSHTSGLPNWRYMTNKMNYLELLSEPGASFSYSGEGYEYLANVVVRLSDGTLADLENLIQKEVLIPFGMERSRFTWNEDMAQNKAAGHVLPNLPNNRWEPLLARVAGGLHSNAPDFARFLIEVMNGTGLSEEALREMLQPAVILPEDHDIKKAYGVEQWTLGFARQNTPYGIKHSHGGNNVDFQSYFEFYRNQRIGYVYMTNCSKGDELNLKLNELLTHGQVPNDDAEYEVVNRKVTKISDGIYEGISLNARMGAGFCWLKEQCFREGTIEFDVRGENLREKSFVGVAFHGQDDNTYESVYFRPYLFGSTDATESNYMVQYISMPQYDWFNLRSDWPGKFEQKVENAPKPNDWFHVKVEVKARKVRVFVNHANKPVLEFEQLGKHQEGKIGFWVGNLSSGDFANLKITRK